MAKSTTTRVHLLAKELGVKSKAIVEKCQAEGLDVKNHMATISAGLAATIREWFSEGDHSTTLETSSRVNLKDVRVEDAAAQSETEPATEETSEPEKTGDASVEDDKADIEPEAEIKVEAKEEVKKEAPTEVRATPEADITKPAKPEAKETYKQSMPQPVVPHSRPKVEKSMVSPSPNVVEPVVPVVPDDVEPAGEQFVPAPAKLSGPKVIRVESVDKGRPRGQRPDRGERSSKPRPPRRNDARPAAKVAGIAPSPAQVADAQAAAVKGGKKNKKARKGDTVDRGDDFKVKRKSKDIEERQARLAAARGETLRKKPSRKIESKKKGSASQQARPEKATIAEPITVKGLASAIAVKVTDIIGKLMQQGIMATANQTVATDVAEMLALDLGTELIVEKKESLEEQIQREFESRERKNITRRAPVVTMLGHVDHGKTSLLDQIRKSSVASGEAGGITQHVSAYQVNYKGTKLTFLDTPGHAAFTAMRARGANMTDIVVLVIAADDGVMPQTAEAIRHAQAAKVPIIIALNKIDLPGVDINRIYGQLSEHDLIPSAWGGDTDIIETSAIKGTGIDNLIEHIDMIAELHDFKADSDIPAAGWVVESKMTQQRGVIATILLKEGKMSKGDVIFAGPGYGKIRAMKDGFGKPIKTASSSMAVEIMGLSDAPSAGDKFYCIKDLNRAKMAAEQNQTISREKSLARKTNVTLDNLFSQIEAGKMKELNIIVRADVQGSVDVLQKYLTDVSTEEVKVKILHAAVGGITQGDVVLAEASGAIVIGFNVVPEDQVKREADEKGVDIRLYSVIYRITEDLKQAMAGLLEPLEEEKHLGKLVVRNTFKVTGVGTIAGCFVSDGVVNRSARMRLIRDNIIIHDNCHIDSLKHFKDDVREVKSGFECGVKITGFDDIKVDDAIEAYEIIKVKREL